MIHQLLIIIKLNMIISILNVLTALVFICLSPIFFLAALCILLGENMYRNFKKFIKEKYSNLFGSCMRKKKDYPEDC
mgnify:CR=1 FL=1